MPPADQLHRAFTRVMSVLMMLVGIAIMVRTLAAGGGPLASGLALGLLFVIAGGVRIFMQLRSSRGT